MFSNTDRIQPFTMTNKRVSTETSHYLWHILLGSVYSVLSAPAKWILSLTSLVFTPTFPPSPHQRFPCPPSPTSLGESSLGLAHESEGTEDLTHLLLRLNTISFQVIHWDSIVFLISPPRRPPCNCLRLMSLCISVGGRSVFSQICVCGPVGWVYGTEREKMCGLPLWLMMSETTRAAAACGVPLSTSRVRWWLIDIVLIKVIWYSGSMRLPRLTLKLGIN